MKYDNFNIVPIGDHCAISMILNELGLRKCSYPFDWVSHIEPLNDTNIMYNMHIINELVHNTSEAVTQTYIGNAFNTKDKTNTENNIWFPHDNENINEIIEKYNRRFARLKQHIFEKNVFVLLTRHYFIEPTEFQKIVEQLLGYNSNSIILFISGTNHPYIHQDNVFFKHIPYDISKFYNYDYSDFRPQMKRYLAEFFTSLHF